jgi:pectin methylesterase-like acyl-CoA thioesterase
MKTMNNPLLSVVRFVVLTLFMAIAANESFAQAPAQGNSRISGIVLDSAAAKGVEFASIALFNAADNKAVDGTTADESGKFAIVKVAPGSYKLMISFIGYKDKAVNVKVEKVKMWSLDRSSLLPVCRICRK